MNLNLKPERKKKLKQTYVVNYKVKQYSNKMQLNLRIVLYKLNRIE